MAVMKSNNTSSVYFTNATNSKNGVKRERLSFTNLDASLIIFSMVTIIAHLVTDINLVFSYYMAGHNFWAVSTVALALIPAAIIQAFSIRWHILDAAASKAKWLSHCLLLGIFFRHVDVLQTGLEARRNGDVADFQSLFHQQSDISMLQLFESFMKSAPQLVLQLYIMIQVHDWGSWTGLSAAASLISLAWAMAAYTHAMRQARPDKQKATLSGLALQAVWRASLLAARITALVLFAICCQAWLFLLLGLHWLGMTVWVVLQKTDLCSTPWEECAYNGVVGIVYCFCFFNLREGRARGRMLAFYVVTVAQNLACLYLFLAIAQHSYPILATVGAGTVVGGTITGLCAMLMYYRFFHPSGPITLFGPPNISSVTNTQSTHDVEKRSVQAASISQVQVSKDKPVQSQAQTSQMPSDTEKTNSLRSLKHLWSVDRDGSISSRSDDAPVHGGSPQPDDRCTDRRLLLSCQGSSKRSVSSDGVQMPIPLTVAEQSKQSNLAALSQNSGLSSITNQSGVSSVTSRSTLNSQPHQSPISNRQGWTSQSSYLAQSNQSVHSTNTSHSTVSGHSSQSNHSSIINRPSQPIISEEGCSKRRMIPSDLDVIDDSKLSWNCTSMMEDTQQSDIVENLSVEIEMPGSCSINKRRGICSSVELGLDKLEENDKEDIPPAPEKEVPKLKNVDDSFTRLCQELVAHAEVKQLSTIESSKRDMERRLKDIPGKEIKGEKRESDYIDSKQSAISSDGTPSEVLSAHDYENICAVNIAREAWGLRSWRGYSDIETWLHDDSVVRDRRRDTLASIGTTTTMTSASSERSTMSESPPPVRHQWESNDTSAPPLPCRRPRPSYNRMDDYLDTLALDLAEIEQRETVPDLIDNSQDNVFMAQPYVVDQHGMLYPLPASLDTILEELEEASISASSATATDSGSVAPGWASSLVATIDEIRMGNCNTLENSVAVSESDFDVGSYRSLQLDSTLMTNISCKEYSMESCEGQQRFSNSLPSLLQAPRSWSHLSPEEVLFLSKLKPQPESESSSEMKYSLDHSNQESDYQVRNGSKPRRKFSILREKFETKCERENFGRNHNDQVKLSLPAKIPTKKNCDKDIGLVDKIDSGENISNSISKLKNIVKVPISYSSSHLQIEKKFVPVVSSMKNDEVTGWTPSKESLSLQGQNLLQQVIAQPNFAPRGKKLSLASNASA